MSFCKVPRSLSREHAGGFGSGDVETSKTIQAGALIVIDVVTSAKGMPANRALHVVERRDRNAFAADFAERQPRRDRGPSASACRTRSTDRFGRAEQIFEALVGVFGRAEAGEHAHRPGLAAIHVGVRAARERKAPRLAQFAFVFLTRIEVTWAIDRL